MSANGADLEDLCGDEGRRIVGDAPNPSDLETGVKGSVESDTGAAESATQSEENQAQGKKCEASTSLGDIDVDCRYCLLSDSIDNLVAPCGCDGTLRWCHFKCLKCWVQEKRGLTCEICGQPYNETIRTSLAKTVAIAQKMEQERRDAALAAHPYRARTPYTPTESDQQPVARLWCRVIFFIIATVGVLYVVLFLSKGNNFSFWTVLLLRVLSFILPFYLIGRGVMALQRYRQERGPVD